MQSFSELKLSPGTLDAVTAMAYTAPSPIQALSIPHFLAGRDLLVYADDGLLKRVADRTANPFAIVGGVKRGDVELADLRIECRQP